MHFELNIVIHRPVEIVFAYVADPQTLPKWGSVKEVQLPRFVAKRGLVDSRA